MSVITNIQDYFSALPLVARILAVYGLFAASRPFLNLIRTLLDCYVMSGIPLETFGADRQSPEEASWALVTGATDGIGKEFALQLASKGFNVFLASRTQAKLDAVKEEISSSNSAIKVQTFAIDFSKATDEDYRRFEQQVAELRLGVLVNNVGMSHDMPVLFHQTSVEEMETIAEINVRATLRVTRLALPVLLSQKKSLVLNLGSFAGSVPSPMLATYAGTKAFMIGWNRALNEEYKRLGVTSILLNTYFVSTAMSKIRKSSWSVPTPKQYVRQVLRKLGRPGSAYQEDRRGREMTIWPQHALTEWAVREFVGIGRASAYSYDMHKTIRNKALKRAEKLKNESTVVGKGKGVGESKKSS